MPREVAEQSSGNLQRANDDDNFDDNLDNENKGGNKQKFTRLIGLSFVPREGAGTP